MPILGTYKQQPNDNLDYDIDFADYFPAGDAIQSAEVTAETGITKGTTTATATQVKQWVTGGTSGTTYKFTVKATTAAGRVKEVEFRVKVKDD
jgi:hypothetical protein